MIQTTNMSNLILNLYLITKRDRANGSTKICTELLRWPHGPVQMRSLTVPVVGADIPRTASCHQGSDTDCIQCGRKPSEALACPSALSGKTNFDSDSFFDIRAHNATQDRGIHAMCTSHSSCLFELPSEYFPE